MADVIDNEELIATRRLHGLDDDLFEEEKEIEVGEYVRTNIGVIGKVIKALRNKVFLDCLGYAVQKKDIVKHSKQLIDLIETGDFVNGYRVLDITKIVEDIEAFKTIYSKEEISICVFVNEAGAYYIDIRDTDIKTILTKESYMANCYKVGGEDEF